MKKIISFAIPVLISVAATAQRTDSALLKKSTTIPVMVNKTVQQQSVPVAVIPPKKVTNSATMNVAELPTQGKDLKILIEKMDDVSGATDTRYVIYYSVINNGTIDIDITNLGLQGVFNRVGTGINLPSGGTSLIASLLKNKPILHPGENFKGILNASASHAFPDSMYKYVLTVDNNNFISEANETNNTDTRTIPAHKQPDIVPGNLKVIYNSQHGRWEISYQLTNSGNNPIDLNNVRFQGYFVALIPYGPPIGGCGYQLGSLTEPTMLNPGESYSGSFLCTQHNLHSGKEYNYTLTFFSSYPIAESNTSNNKAIFKVTAQ